LAPTPIKMLSINGSLLIDQGNKNAGNVDSGALRFGTSAIIGISNNQAAAGNNPQGTDFWTNGVARMLISSTGNVGINMSIPAFRSDVNGSARTSSLQTGNMNADFSIIAGIDVSANDDLFAGDDLNVTNDGRVGGNMAIGASPSSNYKLHVNGNMLLQTNVGINGTARIDGKLPHYGKAIVLSNSIITLRTGFTTGTFTLVLLAGNSADATFCIISFA